MYLVSEIIDGKHKVITFNKRVELGIWLNLHYPSKHKLLIVTPNNYYFNAYEVLMKIGDGYEI